MSIGRKVQPDAVPLVILKPFGSVQCVFELGDTEGQPVPAEKMSTLFATGIVLDTLWDNTVKSVKGYKVIIEKSRQQGMGLACTAARLTDYP